MNSASKALKKRTNTTLEKYSPEKGLKGIAVAEAAICSLRNAAADCGLVRKASERIGRYGKANQVWVSQERSSSGAIRKQGRP